LTDEFHAHKRSPLQRAETLHQTVPDSQLEPQMWFVARPFQSAG
jgi:hypothetical protein